ncbi:MAG: hypothetical protein LCH51_00235 [Bacteroidetes bacterium]|nr:hypothetical protein [Bacteroidota bacterium]
MTIRPLLLAVSVSLLFCTVHAQQGWTYRAFNYAGAIFGDGPRGLQITSMHGFYRARQYAALGTGYEYYHRSSVPLFLAYKLSLVPKFHLYGNANAGLSFLLSKSPNTPFGNLQTKAPPGFLGEAGIDWFKTVQSSRYGFSLGGWYSYRQFQEKFRTEQCITRPCSDVWEEYRYQYSRWIIKAGFVF